MQPLKYYRRLFRDTKIHATLGFKNQIFVTQDGVQWPDHSLL